MSPFPVWHSVVFTDNPQASLQKHVSQSQSPGACFLLGVSSPPSSPGQCRRELVLPYPKGFDASCFAFLLCHPPTNTGGSTILSLTLSFLSCCLALYFCSLTVCKNDANIIWGWSQFWVKAEVSFCWEAIIPPLMSCFKADWGSEYHVTWHLSPTLF